MLLAESYKRPLTELPSGISELKSAIAAIDPSVEGLIDTLCERFRPRLIFNKGEHPDEMRIHQQIDDSLASVLSIRADYFGFIFRDPMVRRSVNSRKPYLLQFPDSLTSQSIRKIADRIITYWERPINDSARRIMEQVSREFHE